MTYRAEILPSEGRIAIHPRAVESTTAPTAGRRHVPLTLPSAQEYYWHFTWQEGERESLAELEAGIRIRFDSDDPEDIIRWLHAPDDTDPG